MRISDWSSDVCSSDLAAAAAEEMLSPFRDVDLVDPRLLLALRHDLVREFLDDAAERDEAVDRVDVVLAAHMLRLEKPVGDRHPLLFRSEVDDTQPFLERRGRLADVARVAGGAEVRRAGNGCGRTCRTRGG